MRWIILLSFLLTAMFFGLDLVDAHGGGDLIVRSVETGPYIASVWVNPPDPRAQEPIHFTISLASPSDGSPVLDADIQVTMRDLSGGEASVTAPATTEQSVNKLFYEADLEVPSAGEFETHFLVRGVDGEGTISVLVEVQTESRVNWLLLGLAGLVLVLFFGWWRSRPTETEAPGL